jgi:hypothetical protein
MWTVKPLTFAMEPYKRGKKTFAAPWRITGKTREKAASICLHDFSDESLWVQLS